MAGSRDELIPTPTTLLERIKDLGDESSWREFFDTYRKLIYGIALKSRLTEVEAQDVVQETMLSVTKHIATFKYDRTIGSFKRWLLNMARWRILDQFRRRETLAVRPVQDASVETQWMDKIADPLSMDLNALWEAEWQKAVLEVAIGKVKRGIDPEKYQIFDFLVNKEWPPQKVADSFGISIDRVYLAKHRIIELIKKEVERIQSEIT
jgi:RNA polymerase sigma-70 factor (ECF subfamily)